jgi:hypothetical protein
MAPGVGQVQAEDGLVDLHPLDALRLETRKHLFVHGQERFEQREAVEAGLLLLA